LVRLSYVRTVVVALPYTIVLMVTSLLGVVYLL
jgi:Na+/H+ antiporter NhaB